MNIQGYNIKNQSPIMNIKQQLTKRLCNFYDKKNVKYSQLTILNHVGRINKIFEILNIKKDYFNISNISNVEMVINILKNKYTNITTLKSYIKSLAVFIQMIDTDNKYENILKLYRNSMVNLNKKIEIRQNDIIENKVLSITQDDIINIKNHYENEINKCVITPKMSIKFQRLYQEYLIFCLYSGLYIPPPRNDFSIMKITNNYEEEKDKLNFNFYDRVNNHFYFNKFKNVADFGYVNYKIPDELVIIIENYIKVVNISGAFLFMSISSGKSHGLQYQENNFGKLIQRIFCGAGVSTLRKAYLTKNYKGLGSKIKRLSKDTNNMMDSNKTALKYYIHNLQY